VLKVCDVGEDGVVGDGDVGAVMMDGAGLV
jgi:hypothetical protein